MKSICSLLLVMVVCTGPMLAQKGNYIKGNGKIVKEKKEVESFSGISVGGAFDVLIKKGNKQEVVLEVDENVVKHVKLNVKGDVLHIGMSQWVQKVSNLIVHITTPDLDQVHASGASDIKSGDVFTSEEFHLSTSGAANVRLSINSQLFYCQASGSSDLDIVGEAERSEIKLSGASELKADKLRTGKVEIESTGGSSAHIHASQALYAEASGGSEIYCAGKPSTQKVNSSGGAEIEIE